MIILLESGHSKASTFAFFYARTYWAMQCNILTFLSCYPIQVQVGGVNFDNEPCASNSECLGGSCQNGVCQKVSSNS